jgi:hypothetical protein
MMLRTGRTLAIFALFAVMTLHAGVASATSITVGQLFFDFDSPESTPGAGDGTTAFFVENSTGLWFPPDLPLTESLVLTSLKLVVDDGSTSTPYDLSDSVPGTPAQSPSFLQSVAFVSAKLTGTFFVRPYAFDDGVTAGFFIPTSGDFSAEIKPTTGPIMLADTAGITIDGDIRPLDTTPEPVPEPATLILVGTGIATAMRTRMKRRNAENSI